MIDVATVCLVLIIICILPCLYRIVMGPHAVDRLLAFDLMGILIAVSLGVFAIIQGSWVYLEIAMGVAVLAFIGTVAIAHYIEKGRIF